MSSYHSALIAGPSRKNEIATSFIDDNALIIPPKNPAQVYTTDEDTEATEDDDFEDIIDLNSQTTIKNPQEYVKTLLAGIQDPTDRARRLFDSQIRVGEHTEFTNAVIALTQQKIEEESSWLALGLAKEDMWKQIRYSTVIKPACEQYTRTDARKKKFLDAIESNWGTDWKEVMDANTAILPSYMSEHLLAALRRLSQALPTHPAIIADLIREQILNRITSKRTGTRATSVATVSDLQLVEEDFGSIDDESILQETPTHVSKKKKIADKNASAIGSEIKAQQLGKRKRTNLYSNSSSSKFIPTQTSI